MVFKMVPQLFKQKSPHFWKIPVTSFQLKGLISRRKKRNNQALRTCPSCFCTPNPESSHVCLFRLAVRSRHSLVRAPFINHATQLSSRTGIPEPANQGPSTMAYGPVTQKYAIPCSKPCLHSCQVQHYTYHYLCHTHSHVCEIYLWQTRISNIM